MNLLTNASWKVKYTPEDGDLLESFYVPVLSCAVRYDRSTGYFNAGALAAAASGVEYLVRHQGQMRLLVGCTLDQDEVNAITHGQSLHDTVGAAMLREHIDLHDADVLDALELLGWLVAKGYLEVKVAIPCDSQRQPIHSTTLFHEKAGIIEDEGGNLLAFNGSINETVAGWRHNWDSFHVYTSWTGTAEHVLAEERSFQMLWADKATKVFIVDVPQAVREKLLEFAPPDDALPRRVANLNGVENSDQAQKSKPSSPNESEPEIAINPPEHSQGLRQAIWHFLATAPRLPEGGAWIGAATCAVTPWPHQIRAFNRMYGSWPPRMLIADEVGLGKTIQAGLVLRQAWLSGRAKRILILAPKAVLRQWQLELREKFNLNWPVYDGGRLQWLPTPGKADNTCRIVHGGQWHTEPFVLASSHLMRRRERFQELVEDAEPWDLIVLDEAHHARRSGGGLGKDQRPNRLLHLMQRLRTKTQGLILLTATPMQVSPVEVWDLLNLFDLPSAWSLEAFLEFFAYAAHPSPTDEALTFMTRLFRAMEAAYGPVPEQEALSLTKGSRIKARKLLRAAREESSIPIRQLETSERKTLVRLMQGYTPIKCLISRHTRELLRAYHKAGKLSTRIADRQVEDRFVTLSPGERNVYEAVEAYIGTTYNQAAPNKRQAIGFIMTVYRRRLASSFAALARTLENRLLAVEQHQLLPMPDNFDRFEEDVLEEAVTETMDAEEAQELEQEALLLEEKDDIRILMDMTKALPLDSKAMVMLEEIEALRQDGYPQIMVFTQYTDTLDFLRTQVVDRFGEQSVLCFSGRGGEILEDRRWKGISREETKKRFKVGQAEIMLCTDAAAEGLNFQFCGALINYDMPWNPMRVEQRIGRIDRLGQAFERIRIVNLHYDDTVETDVYRALRERIQLFTNFVGRLQPILAKLPQAITAVALGKTENKERDRSDLVADIANEVNELEKSGFDLDAATGESELETNHPAPLYSLGDLRKILQRPDLLPPGHEVTKQLGPKDYALQLPGRDHPERVTTDPDYFDLHPESVELWSPGSPVFPILESQQNNSEVDSEILKQL
jgi:ERCC4-related helicase